jgi:hypothetical protein
MRNGFLKAVFCFLVNPHYPCQPVPDGQSRGRGSSGESIPPRVRGGKTCSMLVYEMKKGLKYQQKKNILISGYSWNQWRIMPQISFGCYTDRS